MVLGCLRLAVLVAVCSFVCGCVVVEDDRPTRVRSDGRAVDLGGRVASPALDAEVVNSRVVVGVKRLGSVPFSGQVLPLVSPDGRYLATQVGEAVDWETVLGGPGQTVPARARVEVWSLTGEEPRLVELGEAVPGGSLLGRSADESGFLIERVLADGSRVLERVGWLTGRRVRVGGGDGVEVAAQGTLMPRATGGVASVSEGAVWSRRLVDEAGFGLAAVGGAVRRVAGGAVVLATAGARAGEVHAVRSVADGEGGRAVLVGMRLEAGVSGGLRSSVVRRVPLGVSGEAVVAYQALGSLQTPVVVGSRGEVDGPPGFAFFHPGRGRMVVVDRFTGGVVALADGSSSAAWHARDGGGGAGASWGLFVTTAEGLRYQAVVAGGRAGETLRVVGDAVVLNESFVARSTRDGDWPFVLIGPNRRDPLRLDVLRMRVVE